MELTSASLIDGSAIPGQYAFCIPDPESHATFGPNRNPHLAWEGVPAGTRSFVLIAHDPDVPTKPDDVNQEGREVPSDLPRTDFFHWLVADLPADLRSIAEASFSAGVVPQGKSADSAPIPCRLGRNDYTGWFAADAEMAGDYYGYDGPCPPWNDSRVHHYIFTVFALDIPRVDVADGFDGQQLRDAIAGHVLKAGSLSGSYSLNPRLTA